ncbi:MAG: DUF2442 domain-containing protein [Promicromonosporaceae bacterium]|nr:DUF2442 domain-containing protein [Promicromonosporaceae bacterium]
MNNFTGLPVIELVRPLDHHRAWIVYSDGTQGIIDLKPFLTGAAFASVRSNHRLCNRIEIDEIGSIAWPDGTDIAPESVYNAVIRSNPVIPDLEFRKQLESTAL